VNASTAGRLVPVPARGAPLEPAEDVLDDPVDERVRERGVVVRHEQPVQEARDVRVTIISPGVVESELADTITDAGAKKAMDEFRANAMSPDAIAREPLFAIEPPAGVSVSEIIVRPTGGA
jgi:hypothetical protein